MLLFGAAYLGVRRAMAKDQRRPLPCPLPLWRLLAEEIALMARRIGRWKIWSILGVIFSCYLAVEVALSSATPGPAIAEVWRWAVAAALTAVTLCAWAVLYAARRERIEGRGD